LSSYLRLGVRSCLFRLSDKNLYVFLSP
jgi:hypothetical protein